MDASRLATAEGTAATLVAARKAHRALDGFPGAMPATMAEAYRIQDAGLSIWNDVIAGWKIGLVGAHLRQTLKAERLAGPIFRKDVRTAEPGVAVAFPVFVGGFAAVEGEFVFRMGEDAPAHKTSWTDEEAAALVAALHIGVETAGSPMRMINDLGPTAVSSDFGNNFGVIIGAEIPDWRARMDGISVSTAIDNKVVGTGGAGSLPGGPLAGLRFLLAHLAERGRPLRKGQLVSSGAITGVHDILAGQSSVITFEGCGAIACRAIPA